MEKQVYEGQELFVNLPCIPMLCGYEHWPTFQVFREVRDGKGESTLEAEESVSVEDSIVCFWYPTLTLTC